MALRAEKGGGRPFGWHSGSMTCKDAYILGDLTIQDDIIFGDCSAGKLSVTGGIDMQSTTSAIGIDLGGTFATAAINIDGTCGAAIDITVSDATTSPGRLNYWQYTATGNMSAGGMTGLEIRSTFNGSATSTNGVTGAEIKARHTTGNTYTIGQLRGLVGNADTKNGTTTTAYGVEGSIDVGAGGTITTAACFHGNLNNSGTVTTSYGLFLEGVSGYNLTKGIFLQYITTGIDIGTCTTGILIEGTVGLALGIGSTTPLTTATTGTRAVTVQSDFTGTASTYHFGAYFNSAYTSTGTGSLRALVGQVDYSGTQATVTTPAQYLVAVHGRAKVTGTLDSTVICLTGIHAQLLPGGTFTHANQVAPLWVDWQNAATMSGVTTTAMMIMSNNAGSGAGPANAIYCYAPNVTNLLNLVGATNGGMVAANSGTGTTAADGVVIKIVVDGATLYLRACSAWT